MLIRVGLYHELVLWSFKSLGKDALTYGELLVKAQEGKHAVDFPWQPSTRNGFNQGILEGLKLLAVEWGFIGIDSDTSRIGIDRVSLTHKGKMYLSGITYMIPEKPPVRTGQHVQESLPL